MTFEQYNEKMNEYSDRLSSVYGSEWDNLYEEISQFQQKYMTNVLDEYEKRIDCDAKQYIYDLLSYAVKTSQSGSSIIYIKSKEIADKIDDMIWEEIGDYLLDYEIYEENDHWVVDCMFGGNYVPYWDGWCEE